MTLCRIATGPAKKLLYSSLLALSVTEWCSKISLKLSHLPAETALHPQPVFTAELPPSDHLHVPDETEARPTCAEKPEKKPYQKCTKVKAKFL